MVHQRGEYYVTIKGPMDKAKEGSIEGGRWGWMGLAKVVAGKSRTTIVLEQQQKN